MSVSAVKVGEKDLAGSLRMRLMVTMTILFMALIYFVGFSYSSTIHDAAHDARHGATFPCH